MGKANNLGDFMTDLANAIREKTGTTEPINPQDFSQKILEIKAGGGARPIFTGHADADGLRAIGWTDEDIAYYQENGVNWNEEEDEYHKVTDDNKALYGVLTANNISTYQKRIVYLPKINTSTKTSMSSMFSGCARLVAIPQLDTQNVTKMNNMFYGCSALASIPQLDTQNVNNMSNMFMNCYSLASIPQLDTQSVTNMTNMFNGCSALASIPQLNTQSVTNMSYMFQSCYSLASIPQLDTHNVTNMTVMFKACYSLVTIPQLDTQNVTNMANMFESCRSLASIPQLDTQNVTNMNYMFNGCYALVAIPQLDMQNVTSMGLMFSGCSSLTQVYIKNNKIGISLKDSPLLSKDSLLYLINNEASVATFTITLATDAYDKWSVDADVLAALEAHPNVSLTRTT